MSKLEEKIEGIILRWDEQVSLSGGYVSALAKEIVSAISEDESALRITPGEWQCEWVKRESEVNIPHLKVTVDSTIRKRHGLGALTLADVYGDTDVDAEANAKAIAALPKVYGTLHKFIEWWRSCSTHKRDHPEAYEVDAHLEPIEAALKEAGIEI